MTVGEPLLRPSGASPLARWDVVGKTRRVPTKTHGFVMQMLDASPPTRITLPKRGAAPLSLNHRYIVMEVHTDPEVPFSVEVGVRDTSAIRRTLILSNGCQAPELARGGGGKAKLPLVPLPPGAALGTPVAPGWRLAVFDLDVLIRRAFDGALYSRLDSIALVGVCLVRSVAAAPEPPQVQPPGPVRLVPTFEKKPSAASLKLDVAAALPEGGDDDASSIFSLLEEVDGFIPRARKEALEAAAADEAAKEALRSAKSAEKAFLRQALAKAPPVSADAMGFIPAGEEAPATAPAPASALGAKLRRAVGRLGIAQHLMGAPGSDARRPGDPRDHATTRGGGGDMDAAAIYTDATRSDRGGVITHELAETRSGVEAAQELSRRLRWGTAGEVADLSGVRIGEGGARMLSFTLPKARRLSELRLAQSAIGDKGAAHIATALRVMTTLTYVDLRDCGVGAHGGIALAGAIECGCIGMRALLLGGNALGAPAVAAIVRALPGHTSLHRLDLERTGAAFGATSLFCDGDRVEVHPTHIVHARSGRRVERADAGGGGGGTRVTTLHGVRAGLGQRVDLQRNGRPALAASFAQVGTNPAIEAIRGCLVLPLPMLRVLHLGGNSFGGLRAERYGRRPDGPNVAGAKLGALSDPAAAVESEIAEVAARAAGAAERAAAATKADEAIAMAASAKLCFLLVGRHGATGAKRVRRERREFRREGDHDGGRDDELDADAQRLVEMPPERPLQRSQTMSKVQSASFALGGGRVARQIKPPTGTGY